MSVAGSGGFHFNLFFRGRAVKLCFCGLFFERDYNEGYVCIG